MRLCSLVRVVSLDYWPLLGKRKINRLDVVFGSLHLDLVDFIFFGEKGNYHYALNSFFDD